MLKRALLVLLLAATPAVAQMTEHVACKSDPTQTYTLYLPKGYDAAKKWPALLIFDPRGRSLLAANLFRDAADRFGWILISSNDTRSDGPFEPNLKAIRALWPEVHLRYPTDEKRIYAAGFSGGVIVAWVLAQQTNGIAGIIASGGRLPAEVPRKSVAFAQYGAAGDRDFNYLQMKLIDETLESLHAPWRFEVFSGVHQWMPPELAMEAVGWMEVMAMKRGLRPVDTALVETLFADDLKKADALQGLDARDRYRVIADTYDGLRDVQSVRTKAEAMNVKAEEKERRRWDQWAVGYAATEDPALHRLHDGAATAPELVRELHIPQLQKQSEKPGYEGATAQRVLEDVYATIASYMTRELIAERKFAQAITAFDVAAAIHPDNANLLYNKACAYARMGKKKAALETLARAVDAGFKDGKLMASDDDLASLRGEAEFVALLARLR